MHVKQVQRYILATLVGSVVLGHSLAVAALGVTALDQGGARQGLFVLSTMFGLLAIGAVRVIARRSVLTPWLLAAGLIPALTYWYYFSLR